MTPSLQGPQIHSSTRLQNGVRSTARTTIPAVQPQSTRTLLCLWKDGTHAEGLSWTWWWSHLVFLEWEAYVRKVEIKQLYIVYSPPYALMHNSNQAAPAEWEGHLEDIRTWDTIPLGVNYPTVQGRVKQNTEFWESELIACSIVRNIVAVGYRSLIREPPSVFFKNHASARQEANICRKCTS